MLDMEHFGTNGRQPDFDSLLELLLDYQSVVIDKLNKGCIQEHPIQPF